MKKSKQTPHVEFTHFYEMFQRISENCFQLLVVFFFLSFEICISFKFYKKEKKTIKKFPYNKKKKKVSQSCHCQTF